MKLEMTLNWKHKILLTGALITMVILLGWFTVGAVVDMGNSIAILPANEFNAMSASLEADADYQHALKAQSR